MNDQLGKAKVLPRGQPHRKSAWRAESSATPRLPNRPTGDEVLPRRKASEGPAHGKIRSFGCSPAAFRCRPRLARIGLRRYGRRFRGQFATTPAATTINKNVEVKMALHLRASPQRHASDLNVTYSVNDADMCAEGVWPDVSSSILGAGSCSTTRTTDTISSFGVLDDGQISRSAHHIERASRTPCVETSLQTLSR